MSQITRQEGLAQLRRSHARVGRTHKAQLLHQPVERLSSHRKAATRPLRAHACLGTESQGRFRNAAVSS